MDYTSPLPETVDPFPGLMDESGSGVVIPLQPTFELLSGATGDISGYVEPQVLRVLATDCIEDYKQDLADRRDWQDVVEEALEVASQEGEGEVKDYPWPKCANIKFPLLTTAALQFNARAYPAIVKGDEAVSVKIVGKDRGQAEMGPDGMPLAQGPDGQLFTATQVKQFMAMAGEQGQQMAAMLQPAWKVPPGGKASRAARVADYLNTVVFYRMEDWEADTDALLMQLPIVGCVFRKVWWDAETGKHCAQMVPALRIVVPSGARSCETTPRLTEEIPDVYPHEIEAKMRSGFYRSVELVMDTEEKAGARLLLEQRRLVDLDEDGVPEPYVITLDHDSETILRIEPDYGPDNAKTNEAGEVVSVERGRIYVKYDFFPHPQGKFYGIGLGHLLAQVGAVVNTSLNQLMDAGAAQTAGGGFIASGIRFQGKGGTVRYRPGQYTTVEGVNGASLKDGIVERTLPQVSSVTFQVLDLIMGAARDISGVKDVITGEASNNGQVGTTLALIEQGLQVFNAVYKRVYRALKAEFTLIYDNLAKYADQAVAEDYAKVLDDPQANFAADFNQDDMDIRPVSDPSSVTHIQKVSRAQAILQTANMPGANVPEILKRYYEALDVEEPEKLVAPAQQPDPRMIADAKAKEAKAGLDLANTEKTQAETAQIGLDMQLAQAKQAYEVFKGSFELGRAAA